MSSVVVALSGGVDSAVAALLLQREGYSVTGIFMKNWDEDDGTEYCTSAEDFEDAQRIAEKLGIELEHINFAAEYWDRVFSHFLREYRAGNTPNPDVLCNREIKFGLFLDYVDHLGFETMATGHYARLEKINGDCSLFRSDDSGKDQTYFLSGVRRERLGKCLFPLGRLAKNEVRELAHTNGLHVYDKKDSTGICFIGERRFSELLERYISRDPGEIVDTKGKVIGQHMGLSYYTLGQRKGLEIGGRNDALESPWYVATKNQETNQLVVTQHQEALLRSELSAVEFNSLVDNIEATDRCQAAVRYRQSPSDCSARVGSDGNVRVEFDQPQRAITPGQFVVLYQDDLCLGGARINQVYN